MGAKAHQRGTTVLQKQIAAQERKIAEVSFAQQYLAGSLIYVQTVDPYMNIVSNAANDTRYIQQTIL